MLPAEPVEGPVDLLSRGQVPTVPQAAAAPTRVAVTAAAVRALPMAVTTVSCRIDHRPIDQ
ncbi:hypothetical protein [Streptomyces sp. DH37]|uniref:hypothetical protein n=1 Tax=Streptomyces sp. DH37 TaxID=3040122 RepID=UPI0024422A43|nr:hypothetical protein [Streptomyces sp. DH37]MDG9701501.1 hypothetical protein [Streptomyces sp. DH37]